MNNLKRFQNLLRKQELDGAFVSSPISINYLTGYSTELPPEVKVGSFLDPVGFLFIPSDQNKPVFFADPRYENLKISKDIKVNIIKRGFKGTFIDYCIEYMTPKIENSLGIEKRGLNYLEGSKLVGKLANKKIKTHAIDKELVKARSIKSQFEIDKLKKAQTITDKVFTDITSIIKPGQTELEIANKIEIALRNNGAEPAFEIIVASGSNSATPHHKSSIRKIEKQDIILMDFGARLDGYHSDMTRTVFVGSVEKEVEKTYMSVLNTLEQTTKYIKTEKNISKITHYSQELLKEYKKSSFINFHSLGHGVGLQIHELPNLSLKNKGYLKSGNTVTIEPGVYKKGEYGIRIEDIVVIDSKTVTLTESNKNPIILH